LNGVPDLGEVPARRQRAEAIVLSLLRKSIRQVTRVRPVKTRFYMDPETGAPHVERHGVTEQEVREVLMRALEDRPGRDGSRVALGHTSEGRYLKVIYVPDPEPGSVFVITAYQLGPKAKRALRRRRRKKP
jgi:hypothetical protein